MQLYSRMLNFARPYWPWLLLAIGCSAAAAGLETASMYLVKVVMDEGFLNKDPEAARRMLMLLPLGIVGTMVLKGAFSYAADLLNNGASQRITADVRQKLFDHLLRLPLGFHQHERVGGLSARLTYDATVMQGGVSDVVGRVIGSGLRLLFLLGLIFYLNWRLSLQVLVIFPLAMGPLLYFGRRIRKLSHQDQERMADLGSVIHEAFAGFKVMLAFAAEPRETEKFRVALAAHTAAVLKKLRAAALSSPVMESIGGIGVALMIYLAGQHVIDGRMTMGGFLALIGAIASLYPHVKALNGVNVSIAGAIAAGARVFQILDTPSNVVEAPRPLQARPLKKALELENIRFAYAGGREVLAGVSFTVPAGSRVALVGPSGAGKSTLADLVPRFHDVDGGRILWDGVDIRGFSLRSLRMQVGVVAQDTFLFNDSIASNLAYGRPGATRAQIIAAAKAANAHAFILEQAQGYDTPIGERGIRLSGGQRQRLAIARALLKDPPLLILDEATSALDTESERLVQQALDRLMAGRTTLVIAHRLSTVRHADLIVALDKGKVAEAGTHKALLAKRGLYARLHKLQFAGAKPKGKDA
jgi:subfamily B ATP-binding cassette protein MsbA